MGLSEVQPTVTLDGKQTLISKIMTKDGRRAEACVVSGLGRHLAPVSRLIAFTCLGKLHMVGASTGRTPGDKVPVADFRTLHKANSALAVAFVLGRCFTQKLC
jgi:hypothetical protein